MQTGQQILFHKDIVQTAFLSSANSYYYFSILIKTEIGAVASVYLEGLNDEGEDLEVGQTSFKHQFKFMERIQILR